MYGIYTYKMHKRALLFKDMAVCFCSSCALIAKSKQKASKKDISEYQPKVYKQF